MCKYLGRMDGLCVEKTRGHALYIRMCTKKPKARTDDAHELRLLRQRRGGAHHLREHAGDAAVCVVVGVESSRASRGLKDKAWLVRWGSIGRSSSSRTKRAAPEPLKPPKTTITNHARAHLPPTPELHKGGAGHAVPIFLMDVLSRPEGHGPDHRPRPVGPVEERRQLVLFQDRLDLEPPALVLWCVCFGGGCMKGCQRSIGSRMHWVWYY